MKKSKSRLLGIVFLVPAITMLMLTIIIPMIWNFVLSFNEWNGMNKLKFIGILNYKNAITDSATRLAFTNSVFMALVSTTIAIVSGLFLAIMIYRLGKIEGAIFRFVFFTPSMIPMTIIGILFIFILSPDIGLLNSVLRLVGLGSLQHAWLSDPDLVVWVIAFVSGWRYSGVIMMLCYTGIIGIPTTLFEAAQIDGAGFLKQIRTIILPLIKPTIQLSIVMMLIWSFKTYDIVWAMTKGGPGNVSITVPIRMLQTTFTFNKFGSGAATGVILTLVVSIFIIVTQRLMKGETYES
jgi:raffinose/stachyose/melibiose transport system permease protein